VKEPAASTIKEEIHETSSYEQPADVTMATEIAETDDQDEADAAVDKSDADDENMADEPITDQGAQVPITVDDDDDDDDVPISRTRARGSRAGIVLEDEEEATEEQSVSATRRLTRGSKSKDKKKKSGGEVSSDFEPVEDDSEEHELTASDTSPKKRGKDDDYDSGSAPRGRRATAALEDVPALDQILRLMKTNLQMNWRTSPLTTHTEIEDVLAVEKLITWESNMSLLAAGSTKKSTTPLNQWTRFIETLRKEKQLQLQHGGQKEAETAPISHGKEIYIQRSDHLVVVEALLPLLVDLGELGRLEALILIAVMMKTWLDRLE
jgi:hypothetical protein